MVTIRDTQLALSPAVRARFRAFSEALEMPVTGLDQIESRLSETSAPNSTPTASEDG